MRGEQSRAAQGPRARREPAAGLLERAAKDDAFRRALVEDPSGTLERELGVRLPAGVRLTVLEETATNRYLVLPPDPLRPAGELSEEELDAVAGGSWACAGGSMCFCNSTADSTIWVQYVG
jgi:Nitrile hydratase, alpha chain